MTAPLPVIASDAPTAPAGTPAFRLDPRTYARGLGCVHCGLCLPACPTYTENGLEADSPRGRIQLMLGLHDGVVEPTDTVRTHLDRCLDCRACETACPSNVVYHELIEETMAKLPPAPQSVGDRAVRWTFLNVLTRPSRLKLALLPARLLQKARVYGFLRKSGAFRVLPAGLRKMEGMLPERGSLWPRALPQETPPLAASQINAAPPPSATPGSALGTILAPGSGVAPETVTPRAHVYFFPTCVGSVMQAEVNRKAVDLLAAAGCSVTVSPAVGCCGAIHHHNGLHAPAEAMARQNIDATETKTRDDSAAPAASAGTGISPAPQPPLETYVVTAVAGCGAMLRDYGTLLRDDPAYAGLATAFAAGVRDVSEVLAELGLPAMTHRVEMTVTYHDACHLAHAQRVTAQPRALLAKVPGLTLVPLPESDMCCGAAGTYNLTHPQMAGALADRKLRHVAATGAGVCATGNVGCSMHLASAARAKGQPLTILHPVEILHRAVFGDVVAS
jgi:glycolate oxidase iron-sulfur subunit